jgi:hypothetical protein
MLHQHAVSHWFNVDQQLIQVIVVISMAQRHCKLRKAVTYGEMHRQLVDGSQASLQTLLYSSP